MQECPICKKRKTAILENWIGLDRILFRNNRPKDMLDKKKLKEYREMKSMFLLNLFEIYTSVGYLTKNSHGSIKSLEEYAVTKADLKFQESANLIKTEKAQKELGSIINENMTNAEISNLVIETVLRNAIDAYVFESINTELVGMNKDEAGRLMIEAHRSCRDDIVRLATSQNVSVSKEKNVNTPVTEGIVTGALAGAALGVGASKLSDYVSRKRAKKQLEQYKKEYTACGKDEACKKEKEAHIKNVVKWLRSIDGGSNLKATAAGTLGGALGSGVGATSQLLKQATAQPKS